jgi:hypothetical protein
VAEEATLESNIPEYLRGLGNGLWNHGMIWGTKATGEDKVIWLLRWRKPHGFSHPSNPLVCKKGDGLKLDSSVWIALFALNIQDIS